MKTGANLPLTLNLKVNKQLDRSSQKECEMRSILMKKGERTLE